MTSRFLRLAPAFIASGILSGNSLHAGSIVTVQEDIVNMQRDHVLAGSVTKRDSAAFGANRSGDYYEGAVPP